MKFTLLSMMLLLSNFCFSQNDLEESRFTKDNYTIHYPKAWLLDTTKMMGSEFFIFSPLENELDTFKENVNGIIQDLKGLNIDLEKYKLITDQQLSLLVTDLKEYESSIITENNVSYIKVSYKMTQGKFKIKTTSHCTIKDDKAYLLTFTCLVDTYDKYKTVGEEILNSFRLKD